MEKIRFGVIGAGNIGGLHAENLAKRVDGAQIVAIADPQESLAKERAQAFSIPRVYADYKKLLADAQVQAVIICSPASTHPTIIEEAAQAGKHILCEKPLGQDLASIDRALTAVKNAGVLLQIGFQRRFDSNFAAVKRAIDEGTLGEIHIVHSISRDPSVPPIPRLTMFTEMTIHDLDMVRYLAGSEPVEIHVFGGILGEPAGDSQSEIDTSILTVRFANGAIATIDNSVKSAYGYDQRIEVYGSKGMATNENNHPYRATVTDASGSHNPLPLPYYLDRYVEAYAEEVRQFIQAIADGKETAVPGSEGRASVVMALAALKSLEEGRPIRLAEIDRIPV